MAKRVVLDARALATTANSNRTYWQELILAFVRSQQSEPKVSLVLASNQPIETAFLRNLAGWQTEISGPGNHRLWSLLHLPKLCRSVNADMAHVQYSISPLFRTPVVTTIHDVSYFIEPKWLPKKHAQILRWSVPSACKRAKAVVVVSQAVKDDLLRFVQIPAEKVVVAANGAPTALALPKHEGLPEALLTKPFTLMVGGLTPRKNWRLAVEATAEARKLRPDLDLQLALPGPNSTTQEVPTWAHLLGPVNNKALAWLYRNCLCLVHPAIYEGFGLTPLEAWSYGSPALVSDIPPLRESAGPAGACVASQDPTTWAERILKLIDPITREEAVIKQAAQLGRFTWEQSAAKTREAYEYAANSSDS